MAKKVIKKKIKEAGTEIDLKIKNPDKIIQAEKSAYHHSSNFWIFGSALAMILSYERSASILWTILHGILSWFYILYRSMQIWGWF